MSNPEDRFTDPVEVGTFYVARVLDPFRVPTGQDGELGIANLHAGTVDRLVDLFEPDIKEQQIRPEAFISTVVGSAAMIGIHLPNPQTPNQFQEFARRASDHLDAYYISIIDETEII